MKPNNKSTGVLLLLLAILVTIVAAISINFIPPKRLTLIPASDARFFLLSEGLANGAISSEWIPGDSSIQWRCYDSTHFQGNYFPCAFTIDISKSDTKGTDLSRYARLNLHLDYQGSANKIRIAIRNYNSAYSTVADSNSTKFNALQVHTRNLGQEIHLPLSMFTVSEWWLTQYNIPLEQTAPEINNAMVITVDFAEVMHGTHIIALHKIELEGKQISAENGYLAILSLWMLGIFVYAIKHLLELRAQTRHSTQIIHQLSNTNEQLQQETNKFRRLSTVDPLTQIYNRFGIDQIVASFTGHSREAHTTTPAYSVIMLDIDHFKQVNDQHGHDVGDLVLQHTARIIQTHLRAGDYVGRWGGEEFVIIMPGTDRKTAMQIAETIRQAIATTPYNPEQPLWISASFGISERQPDEDFATCFKRADNALFVGKEQGRNRCVYAEDHL